jgi:hypothetical protein
MAENSQETLPAIRQKRGVPIYTINPSIPARDTIGRTRRVQMGNERRGMIIDGDTGEMLGRGSAVMYEFEEVDKERFVKLFLDGVRKTAGLSTTGLMIFEMIYNQVRDNPSALRVKDVGLMEVSAPRPPDVTGATTPPPAGVAVSWRLSVLKTWFPAVKDCEYCSSSELTFAGFGLLSS